MFHLPDDGEVQRYVCRCNTCSSPQSGLLWEATGLLSVVDKGEAVRVLKADGESERKDDPFLTEELLLAALIANAWRRRWKEQAEPPIVDALKAQPFSRPRFEDALGDAGRVMSEVLTQDDIAEATRLANVLITNGAIDAAGEVSQPAQVALDRVAHRPITVNYSGLLAPTALDVPIAAGTVLENAPTVAQVHEGIVRAAKYYTNRYFNETVLPWITARVDALIDGANPTDVPDYGSLLSLLSRRLQSVPYWRVVANAAASRGYHYGFLKAAELRSVLRYRLAAVLDERTSEICLELNGRVFDVRDAVRLMERIALAEDTEAVKELAPWRKATEVRGLSVDQLRDMGCIVPPFHGLCRTTVRFA